MASPRGADSPETASRHQPRWMGARDVAEQKRYGEATCGGIARQMELNPLALIDRADWVARQRGWPFNEHAHDKRGHEDDEAEWFAAYYDELSQHRRR